MSSDDKTPDEVLVPVELLKRLRDEWGPHVSPEATVAKVTAFIPKLKPRIVAVTFEQAEAFEVDADWFAKQPDLLTVLDGAVREYGAARGIRFPLMHYIYDALGVPDAE